MRSAEISNELILKKCAQINLVRSRDLGGLWKPTQSLISAFEVQFYLISWEQLLQQGGKGKAEERGEQKKKKLKSHVSQILPVVAKESVQA